MTSLARWANANRKRPLDRIKIINNRAVQTSVFAGELSENRCEIGVDRCLTTCLERAIIAQR
jgi:hypothetical protein